MQPTNLSEQEAVRYAELEELTKLGINAFPSELFPVNTSSLTILKEYPHNVDKSVTIAGRIMSKRIMGKAAFAELQDGVGRIQLYVSRDEISSGDDKSIYDEIFKKCCSLGDIVGVSGNIFTTKTGEISIKVKDFKLLAKALRPLPLPKEKDGIIHDAFTDPEQRYRMRYVDLVVNPAVKEVFRKRSLTIRTMRDFLENQGYLEVETPILQPLYGGASARPFTTHHNTLDTKLFLRIANELYLKRLIVGGFEGVFEFAKDFRNEGMSRFHNPEFTMLELYVAYKDYEWMMNLTEEMIENVVNTVCGSSKAQVGDKVIDFQRPWKRITMYDAINDATKTDVSNMQEADLLTLCKTHNIKTDKTMGRGKLLDELFGNLVEPYLIQPTFIIDYPVEMSPLAKKHRTKAGLVERFEAICNGKEICNAFSELNDPIDQCQRFENQLKDRERGDEEAMVLDEDFLRALEYGMPPTAGLGIGIDRLTMILTNQPSIQDVLFFPQMRPEK